MALAVLRDGAFTREVYFDAVKRFCKSHLVGFEYFRLLATFEGDAIETARPFQFLEEGKIEALSAYFQFLTELNIADPSAKIERTIGGNPPEVICSSRVSTPVGTLRLWLVYPQSYALRY